MAKPTTRQDRSVPRYSDDQVDDMFARRSEIEQAKGMIMYVHDVSAETAFDMLQAHSRTTNVKIQLLARQLLDDPFSVEGVKSIDDG